MTKVKIEVIYPDGEREEDDEVFDTEEEAQVHGEYMCSCYSLGGEILKAQGDGNYEFVKEWIATDGVIKPTLQADLDKVNGMGIPTDIYYEMSPKLLVDKN